MKIYLKKLFSHSTKNKVLMFLLFWPSIEIIYYVYNIMHYNSRILKPFLYFYLVGNSAGMGHIFQAIFLWFLPLYLLIISSEDVIEEYKIGLNQVIIGKIGRKKYIGIHLKKSFVLGFGTVFLALLLNLFLVNVIFAGGMNDRSGGIVVQSQMLTSLYKFPALAEVIFSIVTAWCAALISMVGTMLAITIHDRKIVYSITMLLWVVPFLMKHSLMLLFQPFSEYDVNVLGPIFLCVSIVYIFVIMLFYRREVYYVYKKNH